MSYTHTEPSLVNLFQSEVALLIIDSYKKLTGNELIEHQSNKNIGELLYRAPIVVLAHDNQLEPIFFYGNLRAQEVFEMGWLDLVNLPSKNSAEPINQTERKILLEQVNQKGFIDNYSGIRISKTGKRFEIKNAIVWNLFDSSQKYIGQAAAFKNIEPIN